MVTLSRIKSLSVAIRLGKDTVERDGKWFDVLVPKPLLSGEDTDLINL